MKQKTIARYIVTERRSGRLAAKGSSVECARRLGLTYGSFLTLASRSRRGGTVYRIERLEDLNWQQEAARQWNACFGWYRASQAQYPCGGCMGRAYCDYTGSYCPAFARWFSAAYDESAARLRRLCK